MIGCLRLGMETLKKITDGKIEFMIPSKTWPNHNSLLNAAGISYTTYRYIDNSGCALDFEGLVEDLRHANPGTAVLLHAVAHNPTGVDPTEEQWKVIIDILQERNLFPFVDCAYHGFVTGSPEKDAFAARLIVSKGMNMLCAYSFSKNFGLYGERVGAVHFVTDTADEAVRIGTVAKAQARVLYSTCPSYGARIVAKILNDPASLAAWENEVTMMAERILGVRQKLYDLVVSKNLKGTWGHVIAQRGMFSYTGIKPDAVKRLKEEYHIYMLGDGRISLAGLNDNNVERFADALVNILGTN